MVNCNAKSLGITLGTLALVFGLSIAQAAPPHGKPGGSQAAKSVPAGMVPTLQAEQETQGLIKIIDDRIKTLTDRYYYENSVKTLETAFHQHGVEQRVMQYAEPWGTGGLYFAYQEAMPFYNYHKQALYDSLSAIAGRKFVKRSDFDYLKKGMDAWKQVEGQIGGMIAQKTEYYAMEAVIRGQENDYKDPLDFHYTPENQARINEFEKQMEVYAQYAYMLEHQINDIGQKKRLFSALGKGRDITERID